MRNKKDGHTTFPDNIKRDQESLRARSFQVMIVTYARTEGRQ